MTQGPLHPSPTVGQLQVSQPLIPKDLMGKVGLIVLPIMCAPHVCS